MRFRFWICALALMAAFWGMPTSSSAAQDEKTCHDFEYQEDAQSHWDAGNGRPSSDDVGLDANNDGIACNALPRKPATDGSLMTFLGPTAVVAVVAGGGFWWTRRREAAANSVRSDGSKES